MRHSQNIEKLKQLSAAISTREEQDSLEKKNILESVERIYSMLEKQKVNKQVLKDEMKSLMNKLSVIFL